MRFRLFAIAACAVLVAIAAGTGFAASPKQTVLVYDDFSSGTNANWNNPYGAGELAAPDANHLESFSGGYISTDSSQAIVYGGLLVMLLVRPYGLFGQKEIVRV